MANHLMAALFAALMLLSLFWWWGGFAFIHEVLYPNQEGDSGKHVGPQFDEDGNVMWPGEEEE